MIKASKEGECEIIFFLTTSVENFISAVVSSFQSVAATVFLCFWCWRDAPLRSVFNRGAVSQA